MDLSKPDKRIVAVEHYRIELALEKLEKAQSILAGARLWSVSEVADESSRADSFIDDAASYLKELVDKVE